MFTEIYTFKKLFPIAFACLKWFFIVFLGAAMTVLFSRSCGPDPAIRRQTFVEMQKHDRGNAQGVQDIWQTLHDFDQAKPRRKPAPPVSPLPAQDF